MSIATNTTQQPEEVQHEQRPLKAREHRDKVARGMNGAIQREIQQQAQKLQNEEQQQQRIAAVLCLASPQTTAITKQACKDIGINAIITAATKDEAIAIVVAREQRIVAVVAALGTTDDNRIFDQPSARSTLLDLCQRLNIHSVVFSHTASRKQSYHNACLDAGADAVVATEAALVGSLNAGLAELPENYPPLQLLATANKQGNVSVVKSLLSQIRQLPQPLVKQGAGEQVRFVCLSDTHTKHKELRLPPGEVLLHTGDFVGNYGKEDVIQHLKKFSKWCHRISPIYKMVVLVAGNHDTPLDLESYPKHKSAKEAFLASLPSNVVYLEHDAVTYRGLSIYGSPITACRKEALGKRYFSNAFERTNATRQKLHSKIPENVDVLLTHVPPHGILSARHHNCKYLTKRLEELTHAGSAPRFHVFGHDHDYFGVEKHGNTTFVNAAQAGLLRSIPGGGGCPLVFDLPVPTESMDGAESMIELDGLHS
jgi:Icc-related predicted phosphoesterase